MLLCWCKECLLTSINHLKRSVSHETKNCQQYVFMKYAQGWWSCNHFSFRSRNFFDVIMGLTSLTVTHFDSEGCMHNLAQFTDGLLEEAGTRLSLSAVTTDVDVRHVLLMSWRWIFVSSHFRFSCLLLNSSSEPNSGRWSSKRIKVDNKTTEQHLTLMH